ncbi:hypothetical protein HDU97_001593 [Phlyctochytrium planicorne]|nr:hypothetical protein HDU97_001593 [Phlyctochytrium planicorne]
MSVETSPSPSQEGEAALSTTSSATVHDHTVGEGSSKDSHDSPKADHKDHAPHHTGTTRHEDDIPQNDPSFVRVPLPRLQFVLVYVGMALAILLAALDQTIVSTALKAIIDEFQSQNLIPWIGSSYLLTACSFSPIYGKLADIMGRKPVFLFAIIIFEIGSLISGLANSMLVLIAGRAISGIGGGGIFSLVLIIISDIVSIQDRGKYQGIIGAVFGLASVIGPVTGGSFADSIGWRWCFFINLPVGLVTLVTVTLFLRLTPPEPVQNSTDLSASTEGSEQVPATSTPSSTPAITNEVGSGTIRQKLARVDWLGSFLVLTAVASLITPLQLGGTIWAWSAPQTIGCFCASVVLFGLLAYVEIKVAKEPIIPANVFMNRSVYALLALAIALGCAFISLVYFISLYFQVTYGDTATQAGLNSFPLVIGVVVFSVLSGQLVSRTGRYLPWLYIGSITLIIGIVTTSTLRPDSSRALAECFLLICGMGVGCLVQIRVLALQASVDQPRIAIVTAVSQFCQTLGGSIGVAITGTVFNNLLSQNIQNSPELVNFLLKLKIDPTGDLNLPGLRALLVKVNRPDILELLLNAFVDSFDVAYRCIVPYAVLILICTFFVKQYAPKVFEFQYADRDQFEAEINEFYNYQDKLFIQEGKELFEASFVGDWIDACSQKKSNYIVCLLEGLESIRPDERYVAAKKLLYISQGVFGENTATTEQMESMKANNRLLFDLDAFSYIYQSLRVVSRTLDELTKSSATSSTNMLPSVSKPDPTEKQAAIDLANAETSVYLSLIYLLIESNLEHPMLALELSQTTSLMGRGGDGVARPIAVELFDLIAQLAEGNRKHYPVKKLLLLLWKVLLATVGSTEQLAKQRDFTRVVEGLPKVSKETYLKTSLEDINCQQLLTSVKFPAYYLPGIAAVDPPPPLTTPPEIPRIASSWGFFDPTYINFRRARFNVGPGVQPFQSTTDGNFLPKAIEESETVLRKHIYIPHSSVQIAKTKHDLELWENEPIGNTVALEGKKEKENLVHGMEDDEGFRGVERIRSLYGHLAANMSTHIGMLVRLLYYVNLGNSNGAGAENSEAQGALGTENLTYADLQPSSKMTKEQRRDYLERVDVVRHKEVVTKAVSAIILILLKSLKSDHALKFEYVSQLLVENNCAILILKMLSLWFQNAPNKDSEKSEGGLSPGTAGVDMFYHGGEGSEDNQSPGDTDAESKSAEDTTSASEMKPDESSENPTVDTGNSEDPTSPTNATSPGSATSPSSVQVQKGSWRNFFTAINLLRILQKISKKKTHRILSLVQWKASAVLKRVLKVQHVGLQLYALKLLKSQIPYLGRKWRGSNMKVITGIFMHLRPNSKEEYLAAELDMDSETVKIFSASTEDTLKNLVAFYNHQIIPSAFSFPAAPTDAKKDPSKELEMDKGRLKDLAEDELKSYTSLMGVREHGYPPSKPGDPMHDEVEAILNIVRKGTELHTMPIAGPILEAGRFEGIRPDEFDPRDDPIYNSVVEAYNAHVDMPPPGRNHYKTKVVEDDRFGLDENFMQHYELWLQQEVFSESPSLWDSEVSSGLESEENETDDERHEDHVNVAGFASSAFSTVSLESFKAFGGDDDDDDEELLRIAFERDRGRSKTRSGSAGSSAAASVDSLSSGDLGKSHRLSLQIPSKHHHRHGSHHHGHRHHPSTGDVSDRRGNYGSPGLRPDDEEHYVLPVPAGSGSPFLGLDTPEMPFSMRSPDREVTTEDEGRDIDPVRVAKESMGWGVTTGPWLDGEDEFLDLWGMPLGGVEAVGSGALMGTSPLGGIGDTAVSPTTADRNGRSVSASNLSMGLIRSSSPGSGARSPYAPRHHSSISLSPLRSVLAEETTSENGKRDRSSSRGRTRRYRKDGSSGSSTHSPLGSAGQLSPSPSRPVSSSSSGSLSSSFPPTSAPAAAFASIRAARGGSTSPGLGVSGGEDIYSPASPSSGNYFSSATGTAEGSEVVGGNIDVSLMPQQVAYLSSPSPTPNTLLFGSSPTTFPGDRSGRPMSRTISVGSSDASEESGYASHGEAVGMGKGNIPGSVLTVGSQPIPIRRKGRDDGDDGGDGDAVPREGWVEDEDEDEDADAGEHVVPPSSGTVAPAPTPLSSAPTSPRKK